ncbi:MAG: SusC/RagA family TonB-linked outer membrane protein [Gemmatimonas sp.]|nr:SusC/RagA family TonB-linked outer membrane protein [Gemmatimonas sp.]
MLRTIVTSWLGTLAAAALLTAVPIQATAQTSQVTGTVLDAETGAPLSSVQVFVDGTSAGALTNQGGAFVLEGVPPGTHTLVAQRIGYQEGRIADVEVEAGGSTSVNITLQQSVLALQGIVATGLIDPVEGVRAPIAVARVDREMMPVTVGAASAVENLQGRVAGLRMNRESGQPGEGVNIMLRTPTSLRQSGAPLIVVDGVILSGLNEGGVGATVDLDGMDIESMEVIRGAAAASLYGSRAAAGVIAITTKDGSGLPVGTTRFTASTEYGISENLRGLALNNSHAYLMDPTGSFYVDEEGNPVDRADRVLPEQNQAFLDNPYPSQLYNNVNAITKAGQVMTNNLSIQGNAESTNFAISLNNLEEEGSLIGNEGYQRTSIRANLDHRFIDALNLGVSMYHARDSRDNLGGATPFVDGLRAPRDVDFGATNENGEYDQQPDPNIPVQNPLWEQQSRENDQSGVRTLANMTLAWNPITWFSASSAVSYDRADFQSREYVPKGTPPDIGEASAPDGSILFENRINEAWNAEAQATLRRDFGPLNVRTTFRGLLERDKLEEGERSGENFFLFGVPQLSNTRVEDQTAVSNIEEVRATGYLWDTAFDYAGRYIFSVLGRRDGSSLFGADNRWHNYYRVAGAWRLSEEDWFNIPNVSEFKLSVARGTAGGRPSFEHQYETWELEDGIPTKDILGNRLLAPEHTTENEFSLNVIFNDRVGVVLTHARQRTEDQLTPVPLPAITGYATQWINTGTISGHSTELQVEAQLIEQPNFGWTSMVVADYSNAVIEEWDAPCYAQGWLWNCENVPVYGIYSRWLVKDRAGLNQHDNGALLPHAEQFEVNDEGFLVWVGEGNHYWEGMDKDLWGTSTEINGQTYGWGLPFYELTPAGLPHRTLLGEGAASNFGWINNFRFGNFTFNAALHASIGGDTNNRSHQRMYNTDISTAPRMDQAGKPDELKKPLSYFRAAVDGDNSYTIEDSSYLKLRSLSATYNLGQQQVNRFGLGATGIESMTLGVVVRNVFTITNYDGFDPEGGLDLNARTNSDAGTYPPTRNLTAQVTVTF